MIPEPPPGQGPIDPRGAFAPPPPPEGARAAAGGGGAAPFTQPGASQGFQGQPRAFQGGGMGPMGQMPYGPMMPMMMPPYGPPPRKGGFLKGVLIVVVLLLLLGGGLLALVSAAASGMSNRQGVLQTQISVGGDIKQKVAVIPVSGVILNSTAEQFNRFMTIAEADQTVKAVVIEVETPGGAVTPSDRMYHRVTMFKAARPGVPVIVTMGSFATSGGYYLSCGADYIFAQPTTLTGNIGVRMEGFNINKLASKWGVEDTTVTAPRNGFKNAGSMFAPVKEEDAAYLQGLIDETFAQFKSVVSAGRSSKLTKPIDIIADGKAYTAKEALRLGLVDAIGYPEDAYTFAATKAGLNGNQIVRYHEPSLNLLDLISGGEGKLGHGGGKMGAGGVSLNGINVNVDSSTLDELTTPRMLYMWRGQ